MAHNAVGREELQGGHLKQGLVEEELAGCGAPAGLLLQALLNEFLEGKEEEVPSGPGLLRSRRRRQPQGSPHPRSILPVAEGPPAGGWHC